MAAMRAEWTEMAAAAESAEDEETRAARRNLGQLSRGLRTPESAYVRPVLEALEKRGGRGKVAEILESVGEAMKPRQKGVEFDPLASDPKNPRWSNAAQ